MFPFRLSSCRFAKLHIPRKKKTSSKRTPKSSPKPLPQKKGECSSSASEHPYRPLSTTSAFMHNPDAIKPDLPYQNESAGSSSNPSHTSRNPGPREFALGQPQRHSSNERNSLPALALVGNPGSGKSTILNGFVDHIAFRSGICLGTGLTTVVAKYEHQDVTVYDTPGLADIDRKKHAGQELDKLLATEISLSIVFVVTLERGRVRPEDALSIELVLDAIKDVDINNKFGVIINQESSAVRERFDAQPEILDELRMSLLGKRYTDYWFHIPLIEEISDEMDAKLMTVELKHFLGSLPETKPPNAVTEPINTESMEERLEELAKLEDNVREAGEYYRRNFEEERRLQNEGFAANQARLEDEKQALIRNLQKIHEENAAERAAEMDLGESVALY